MKMMGSNKMTSSHFKGKDEKHASSLNGKYKAKLSASNRPGSSDVDAEINALKAEVAELKNKLVLQETYQNFDPDLVKLLLQNNIRYAEENNTQHIVAMKAAVEAINISELEKKTTEELSLIKDEIQHFKNQLRKQETYEDTVKEIATLRDEVIQQLKEAEGKTREELHKMILSDDYTAKKSEYQKTQEDLQKVKQDLILVKLQLKETEKVSKLQQELATLKKSLESEMWNSQGISTDDMMALKSAIKMMDKANIQNKNFDELSVIRRDVQALRAEIKESSKKQGFQEELSELKKQVAALAAIAGNRASQEINALDDAIDSLGDRQSKVVHGIGSDEMELSAFNHQKEVLKIQEKLVAIKTSIKSDISESREKNRESLEALRINLEKLQAGNTDLPDSIFQQLTKEMKELKEEVEEQNKVNHRLEKLKKEVSEKIQELGIDDDEKQNLSAFKQAVDAVVAFEASEDSEAMLEDFTSVHGSIKDVRTSVNSSIDLQAVNEALKKKLKMTDSASQRQLEEIISVVDKLDVKSLAGESKRGNELNKELEATKHAVKSSELYRTISRLESALSDGYPRLSRSTINHIRTNIDRIKKNGDNKSVDGIEESLSKARKLQEELFDKTEGIAKKKGLRRFLRKIIGNHKVPESKPPRIPKSTANTKKSKIETEREAMTRRSASDLVIYQGFEEEEELDPPLISIKNHMAEPNLLAHADKTRTIDQLHETSEEDHLSVLDQKDAHSIRSKLSVRSVTSNKSPTYKMQSCHSITHKESVGSDCEKEHPVPPNQSMQNDASEDSSNVLTESPVSDIVSGTYADIEEDPNCRIGEDVEKNGPEFVRSSEHLEMQSKKAAWSDRYSPVLVEDVSDSSDYSERSSEKEISVDLVTSGESHEEAMIVDLSQVSVSMVNPNEHGEVDIETVVEMNSVNSSPRHSLPLVMSI
jgi:DNA-binding ferritin-like protein (Dps family)